MRLVLVGRVVALVVALALCVSLADAKPPPKAPPSPDEVELKKLETELRDLQIKQAYIPAAKLARKMYDLQRKIAGDDAPMTRVREMTLAGMLAASGDDLGAHKIYLDLLADAEAKHGADSREVLNAIPTVTSYFYTQGQYEDVEPYLQRAIAIAKKLDGDHST